MQWSRLGVVLGLAIAAALARTPTRAEAQTLTQAPTRQPPASSDADALASDITQLMFRDVDWRARMLAGADLDAQAARSGMPSAWTPVAKQALLDEADYAGDDIDPAIARYFARYFSLDELAAGDALMHGEAGRYIAQFYSDPTQRPAPTDSVRQAFSQALATPAGAGFLHKLDDLGRHPAVLDDVAKPAFALGFLDRLADLLADSDAARSAAAQPQDELQRDLLEVISILMRDVDYTGFFDKTLGGAVSLPERPEWLELMKRSAVDTAAADHHEVDRIVAMSLSGSFTLDEVDTALAVLRTPEGAAISREVAAAAAGHAPQTRSRDDVVATQRMEQTAAGRAFMNKFSQFGRLAQSAHPQIVAFEVPRILHRFVEQAEAQEASRPLPPMTEEQAPGS
ncbi:MAG TPA: hypothetical protein VME40_03415 [Caulobacteraceae bacterium]|nr:hypothetical protein [Caulobacteraceae bacterium]